MVLVLAQFCPTHAKSFFIEGIVQESSVFQQLLEATGKEHFERGLQLGLQQGTELGARQTAREFLFSVLDYKFDAFTVRLLQPALEEINDVNVLKQLLDVALKAESLESFVADLNISVNGS